MEYWHPNIARADQQSVIRTWARLEGKSAAMSDDLFRRHVRPRECGRNSLVAIGLCTKLAAAMYNAWPPFDSR